MSDLVDRLRAMAGPIKPNVCTEAADEIERLRAGGCARDQRTTQYCAEAVRIQAEIERLRKALQDISQHPDEPYSADYARDALASRQQ